MCTVVDVMTVPQTKDLSIVGIIQDWSVVLEDVLDFLDCLGRLMVEDNPTAMPTIRIPVDSDKTRDATGQENRS